jgi:hypothetical protein
LKFKNQTPKTLSNGCVDWFGTLIHPDDPIIVGNSGGIEDYIDSITG